MSKKFSPYILKSVLVLLLREEDFREKYFPILSPEHFNHEDKLVATLAKAIWLLADKYGKFPHLETIAEEVFKQKGANIGLYYSPPSKEELSALKTFFLDLLEEEVTDRKYVEDNLIKILTLLSIQKVILSHKEDFTTGELDYDEFAKEIAMASTIATPMALGVNLLKDLDKRTETRNNSDVTPGLVELNIPHFKHYLEEGGLPPGSLAFFLAPTNGGKSERINTPILMYDGSIKNIQDVVVGDLLMGPDSLPRTVLSTHVGYGPMYNLVPVTGDIWGVNDKHILTLINTESKNRYKNSSKLRNIIDIPVNEYLLKSNTFKHKYKLFIPDQIEFPSINPPSIDPYFLGLYFGDGTKNLNEVSITSMDLEIEQYCVELSTKYSLNIIKNTKGNRAKLYRFSHKFNCGRSNILLDSLREIVGQNFNIPASIKYGSIDTRLKFLAGFVDTDGYLHHGAYEIIQKRKDYVEDLAFIARSLGLRANYKECTKTIKRTGFSGKYWRLNIAGDISKIPVLIPRKKATKLEGRKQGKRTGFKLEYSGEETNYGFELDGDGRYLHGDFTVTHNSSALIHIAHDAALQGHNVLYVTAELSEDMIKRRFDACMTGVGIHDIKKYAGSVRGRIVSSPQFMATASRIHIVEVPIGTCRPSDIDILIEKLRKNNFNTNLLVVDYADNLRPERKFDAYRLEVSQIYKDLRALAQKHRLVCWTASQMNDSGSEAAEKKNGVLTIRHVNESRGKIHLADLCIGIARTQEEKDSNIARLVLLKNRLGSGDGACVQVNTRFDISRVFGDEKNIVRMSDINLDDEIRGLEGLASPDLGDEPDKPLTPSSLKKYFSEDESF